MAWECMFGMSHFNPKDGLSPAISRLAAKVLTVADYKLCIKFADDIGRDGDAREGAVNFLLTLYPEEIKRPIYYLKHEITSLPDRTRPLVLYCAAYIELVLKNCTRKKKGIWSSLPTGPLLVQIKKEISEELFQNLKTYNELFSRRSKHDYVGYDESEHLFELEDVIFCTMITRYLVNDLLNVFSTEPPCPGCGAITRCP